MSSRLYTPPAGYYDLPFAWVFDASTLTDGNTYLNQNVPIFAGYGDFILRRIVGLDRVLNHSAAVPGQQNPPGQFQIRDSRGRYIQELPQYVGTGGPGATQNPRDIALSRELVYKENTSISLDLYDILRATDLSGSTHSSAQIAFMGVRRVFGTSPLAPKYKYRPKFFAYNVSQQITQLQSNTLVPIKQTVQDYDFELHEIVIVYDQPAFASNLGNDIFLISPKPGSAGNGPQLIIPGAAPNQTFNITVSGNVVHVTLQTDAFGNAITSIAQLVASLNANLAVQPLFSAQTNSTLGSLPAPFAITLTLAGGGVPISVNAGVSVLQLYDYNRVQVSSIPISDIFINRLSYDQNGALVPPLWYPQQSIIEMDLSPLLKAGVYTIKITYKGVRRVPC
jgi:hypothetical protein